MNVGVVSVKTKTCIKCLKEKPYDEFYQRPEGKDGYRTVCIECWKKRVYAYKALRKDAYRGYAVQQNIRHLQQARHIYKARNVVNSLLKSGELTRHDVCSRCNLGGNIHAHHEDYDKPDVVVWLCFSCHMKRHREIRNARRDSC